MTEHKCFVFKFADIEVREREFRVTKAGEVLAVEPKAFRVLLFLLHNPKKLVTKDELLDAVWNDVAVSENSAARAIAQLRRLLGDDIREPRYIATVATVGYRLLCAVEVSEDLPRNVESPDQSGSLNHPPHGLRKNAVIFGGSHNCGRRPGSYGSVVMVASVDKSRRR